MLDLNSKIPSGPLEQKWDQHRFSMKLVNPANKRKHNRHPHGARNVLHRLDSDARPSQSTSTRASWRTRARARIMISAGWSEVLIAREQNTHWVQQTTRASVIVAVQWLQLMQLPICVYNDKSNAL